PSCEKRFSTVEQMQLMVLKRSGATEPFARDKAVAGVRAACKGRPVSEDDLARLGQTVEDTLRAEGWAEVPANEVGVAILGPLRADHRQPSCAGGKLRAGATSSAPSSTTRSPPSTTARTTAYGGSTNGRAHDGDRQHGTYQPQEGRAHHRARLLHRRRAPLRRDHVGAACRR